MHVTKVLHILFQDSSITIDKRLKKILFEAAASLSRCKQLSIFSLGRSLLRPAKVKHNIKSIDRLFGNHNLHTKKHEIYQVMTRWLLKGNERPIIIIDWSGLTRCGAFHFLRASLPVGGRTLTLYEQAYPLKDYTKDKIHREFLEGFKKIIPTNCKPIIITDAGFRNPWFRAVLEMGWDFIGRIRNRTQYRQEKETRWYPIKSLYAQATYQACEIGKVFVARSEPLSCYFYLKRQKKKFREKRNLAGKKIQCSVSKKHELCEKEPWLIASSLSSEEMTADEIMILYKKRMQIEESFRDLKNSRNGFSLRHCRSFKVERLNIALLIAAVAMFVLWLLGTAAKQRNLHYSFQANTEKRKNVLSNYIIGWQVLIRNEILFSKIELMDAMDTIIANGIWRHS